MQVTIKDGKMTIVADVKATPNLSASNKTFSLVSETGKLVHDGKAITIGLNGYFPNPDYVKP